MRRIALIVTLIIAGEMVFGLPFHTSRFFRPTMLEVFGMSLTDLGDMFAWYGVTAMVAYFPGGALADRFSARSLITMSMLATAAGGLYMATIPGQTEMNFLFAYFGVTTIFLIWGALIRATRDWGGSRSQGMAFGLLDGGRGLAAALVAGAGVALLTVMMPADVDLATAAERREAFRLIILMYSGIAAFAGVLAWLLIPLPPADSARLGNPFTGVYVVLRSPVVWVQAAIIVCAYCGYKGLDNVPVYANQILGMNEIDAARLATLGAYIRPVAAISAGLIADRFTAVRSILLLFGFMLLTYIALALVVPSGIGLTFIYLNILVSFFAVFALRGVYFALLEDNRTPIYLTGTTVGIVSFVGYTPDVFFGAVSGRILDANPGVVGFTNYFLFLGAIALVGIAAAGLLTWMHRQGVEKFWPVEIKDPVTRSE